MAHLTEQFKRAKSYSDNCPGTQKSKFLGPKRLLKTQILDKKGKLSSEKTYLTNLSQNIDYDKTQGTIHKGPQIMLTTSVQMIRSFLWDLRGRWKKTLRKEAFVNKKKIWPIFPHLIECEKPQGTY